MRLDYPCLLNAILQITDLTPTEMYKSKASWGLHFHRTLAGSLLVRQKVKQKTFWTKVRILSEFMVPLGPNKFTAWKSGLYLFLNSCLCFSTVVFG